MSALGQVCDAGWCSAYGQPVTEDHIAQHLGQQPAHPPKPAPATVVNGGEEVNLREMLSEPWMPELAERLFKTLGRKYLAHQLVSMLPADVALRLVDRVDEVVEHQVSTAVERIHQDVDGAVALTLARLAEAADAKRREISRERFTTPSRLS